LTALEDELAVDNVYVTALTDYTMYRALQKDSDFSAGAQRAEMHMRSFQMFMGSDGEPAVNPNLQTTPFDPAVKGAAR